MNKDSVCGRMPITQSCIGHVCDIGKNVMVAQTFAVINGAVVGLWSHQHCLSVYGDRRVAEGFQLHVRQLGLGTSWVLGSIESSRLAVTQAASASVNLIFCEKNPKDRQSCLPYKLRHGNRADKTGEFWTKPSI